MRNDSRAVRTLRWSILALGLALPTLTLVPLGSIWLWEHGLILYWAAVATLLVLLSFAYQLWLFRDTRAAAKAATETAAADPGDPAWTPAETSAWKEVQAIASTADPEATRSREAVLDLGTRAVDAVARTLHPEKRDPLLQFTAPEALALVARVSTRMDRLLRESVPLGDRVTLAQLMTLYRWRGAWEMAEKAYDVWRAIRVVNPISAVASEVRERMSKEMMGWGKDYVARRLLRAYVEEVGRAAIDLYGGRLRLDADGLGRVTDASRRDVVRADTVPAEPLRILVAGQISAGKSSLVSALASEVKAAVDALPATAAFTPYRLTRDGLPAALIIDSPGIRAGLAPTPQMIEEAAASDLVLWVVAGQRADREADRAALTAIRAYFAAHTNRRRPPVMLVVSHIDRLRPFGEWKPPYDLADAASAKAASIRAAVEAASTELGFEGEDVVPVCLATDPGLYNVDALWARIGALLPEAERARLVRLLRDTEGVWDWQRVWSQAKSGGRILAQAALKR